MKRIKVLALLVCMFFVTSCAPIIRQAEIKQL